MLKGIDTSVHNGAITEEILHHVDFVLVRCGFGSDIQAQDDRQYANTVALCEKLNKPYGVYLYSYALHVNDAKSEARHIQRLVGDRKPPLGLWFDMEDADGYKKKHGGVSNAVLVDICDTFCSLTGAGIYASLSWLNNQLSDSRLDKYKKWVAQWSKKCTYKKPYTIWQNTDSLIICGRRFDGNLMEEALLTQPDAETVTKTAGYGGAFPSLPSRGYFRKWDKGAEVKKLQQFLNWYGGYGLAVDGIAGNLTESAVRKFQAAEKLAVDGLFGKASLAKAKQVVK